jgi:hypothetical protein
MKKIKIYTLGVGVWALPILTFGAEQAGEPKIRTLRSLIVVLVGYLELFTYLLMAVALLAFIYYVVKYFILSTDNRSEAGLYVMWSVIGFFVILSVWGMVNILQNTFNLDSNAPSWQNIQNLFPGPRQQNDELPPGWV